MLDFYIIEDQTQMPSAPEAIPLTCVGGLDDKTFHNLQKKGVIDERFLYYSDFRWGTEMILQIRQAVRMRKIESDTDVYKLIVLLDAAERHGSGLVAYGD